ncbi:MAG: hypothetical protein A2V96_02980 [Candidatus Yonathbacteria bacterium RBG_16_43_6]|uniref:BSD domain-containing protein n=1 Tax=Candidatus Yonathbacteria bacterium RIFCSPLOWO2_01_FULL_43_27 TaxID=1802726 RepID=A0A1G2SCV8_9BACT|nr:MAG: hypothetical protein A2V96_02980 [Candidatus Yonathbacteria bacterium RBG_16_43_6]OHA82509.1 MAG: hypothetical protein A3B07_02710 [Candidatus Yonathbacteria bacterium RIFCSPLOWO2_01_FULL_43_27]
MTKDDFWRKYFAVYDVLNELRPYQNLLGSVKDNLKIKKGDLVLDAGAGTGNLAIILSNIGAQVVAFDSSKEGLDLYKQKQKDAIVEVGDILKPLPFKDNYFDKICSNNVLYTLPRTSRVAVAKELHRVLKPGGVIVVSNIVEGFSPLKIYFEQVTQDFKNNGIVSIFKIFKFLIPTIKIFYYNSLIKKENKSGSYDFFKQGEQKALLSQVGFKDISDDHVVYAGQGILNTAQKI